MSDPAEKAANLVALEIDDKIFYHHMLDSAREALKPIRAWYEQRLARRMSGHEQVLLGELAELIYSSEDIRAAELRAIGQLDDYPSPLRPAVQDALATLLAAGCLTGVSYADLMEESEGKIVDKPGVDLVLRAETALVGVSDGPWEVEWETEEVEFGVGYRYPYSISGPGDVATLSSDVSEYHKQQYGHRVQEIYCLSEADAEFIAAARTLVPDLIAEVKALRGAVDQFQQERRRFTRRLGYGDDISEPAASLDDMIEPIEAAFMEQRDHWECPLRCESCGERLAETEKI